MNGSRPKPPTGPNASRANNSPPPPPRKPRKPSTQRRRAPSSVPWLMIGLLFGVYCLIGLLISIPSAPYWVWIVTAVAIPLLVLGCNRPVLVGGKTDRGGLMAYLGGLMMAVGLAVAANYIGSENSFEDVRFFIAIAGLAGLVLLAVLLTIAAAITSAIAGAKLMEKLPYSRSVIMVMSISFLGLCVGGVGGLLATTLAAA
ncbi:MAG: hypothetical protein AAFN12_01240 [Cyanobacteria bacterium J06560_2]